MINQGKILRRDPLESRNIRRRQARHARLHRAVKPGTLRFFVIVARTGDEWRPPVLRDRVARRWPAWAP